VRDLWHNLERRACGIWMGKPETDLFVDEGTVT